MDDSLLPNLKLYSDNGFSLVPVSGKLPQLKNWPNSKIKDLDTFISHSNGFTTGAAFLCGSDNGVYCLDVDPRNGGAESLKRFEEEFGPLPETVTVETGGGGLHYYFHHDQTLSKSQSAMPGMDLQGFSSLAVIAGSKHESSRVYKFREGCALGEVKIAPMPRSLLGLFESPLNKSNANDFVIDDEREIPEGQRDEALFRIGLNFLNQGLDPKKLQQVLLAANRERAKPPLSEKQIEKIVKSCLKNTKKFYGIMEGCLAKVGDKLCNFDLRITKEIIKDDGQVKATFYELAGTFADGDKIDPFIVPSAEFFNHSFIARIGRRAIPVVGPFQKDHIKSAIQDLSENVKTETIYTHTGFKEINNKCVFLHSNGALGADGNDESIKVDLMMSQLSAYCLEYEPDGEVVTKSVRNVVDLLSLAPDYLIFPLLARNFRAPLSFIEPVGSVLYLTGPTGCYKSTLLALKLSFFGRTFSHNKLPGNFESTANSIENIGFRLKDVVFGIDDLAPDGSLADVQAKGRMAARIIRAIGNGEGSGRNRMNTDGTLRTTFFFRSSVDITAEDVVKGSSVRARCLILPMNQGDIDVNKLSYFQKIASQGVFVRVMSSYISWLCPKIDELKVQIPVRLVELRSKSTKQSGHQRTPDAIANLGLGFEYFLKFGTEIGAITDEEAKALDIRAWKAFQVIDELQKPFHTAEDPSLNFIGYLKAAFLMGKCHLKSYRDSQKPPLEYESFGWFYDSQFGDLKPKGSGIGYVDTETPEIILDPNAAFAVAQDIAKSQGSSINISRDVLWKRLSEAGLILRSESEGKNVVKRSPNGVERSRFIVFADLNLFINSGLDSNQRNQDEMPMNGRVDITKLRKRQSDAAH